MTQQYSNDQQELEPLQIFECKLLRDTREMISNSGLSETLTSIEQKQGAENSRLFELIAEEALEQLDLNVAEKAFSRCEDF